MQAKSSDRHANLHQLNSQYVKADVNYTSRSANRLSFNQDPKRANFSFDRRSVSIWNGRTQSHSPTLEREGLQLLTHQTEISDFHDSDLVSQRYLPEIEQFILKLTGASRVYSLAGAVLRFSTGSPYYRSRLNSEPARFPHLDFTPRSSPGLVDGPFGIGTVSFTTGQRLTAYNIWRALSPPPQDVPLALCDARTLASTDLLAAEGTYEECDPPWWNMEAYLVCYNECHRWLYFPDMHWSEVLVFKSFDFDQTWQPGVAHMAFDDISCPPEANARESVEVRVIAVFE